MSSLWPGVRIAAEFRIARNSVFTFRFSREVRTQRESETPVCMYADSQRRFAQPAFINQHQSIVHRANSLLPRPFDKRLSTSLFLPCEKIVFVGNRCARFVWLWQPFKDSRYDHQPAPTASVPTAVGDHAVYWRPSILPANILTLVQAHKVLRERRPATDW